MKKTFPLGSLFAFLLIILPLIYAGSIYSSLPQTIPVHFGIDGKPNGYTDKSRLWLLLLVMSAISAGMYLLVKNLPKIDPKKTAGQSPDLFNKIAMTLVIFMCAISIILVYASLNHSVNINRILIPLLGLLFMVLGNYMHSVKPNYFVGFRLPWTLENEDNWRKTHQLVGKLWVPGGLFIAISALLLPPAAGFVVFMAVVLIIVAIPGIFSYLYFKKHHSL